MKPITPAEAAQRKNEAIPDYVIEAFNELISKNFNSITKRSRFLQKEVLELILKNRPEVSQDNLFKAHALDVEDIYRSNGWIVKYDSPAYCESYDASFEFSMKG